MAAFFRSPSGELLPLAAFTEIGKRPACIVRVDSPYASTSHARLCWKANHWTLEDTSRNGTFVDGAKVLKDGIVVRAGARIQFGEAHGAPWVMEQDGAPALLAHCPADGRVIAASGTTLVLPSEEAPEAVLYAEDLGDPAQPGALVRRWWCERGSVAEPVEEGSFVPLSPAWQVHLPVEAPLTRIPSGKPRLKELTLHLRRSRRGGMVSAWAEHGGSTVDLGAKAFWPVLVPLVEQRLADAAVSEWDRGWLHKEKLMARSGIPFDQLDAYVSKVRTHLRKHDIEDADDIVQARPMWRRLGIDGVVLHEADEG